MRESADLRLVLDSVPAVTQILDQDNQVYLYDRDKGFFILIIMAAGKPAAVAAMGTYSHFRKTLYGFSGRKMYSMHWEHWICNPSNCRKVWGFSIRLHQ